MDTIYGKNAVSEAINAGRKIHELYVTEKTLGSISKTLDKARIKPKVLDKQKMNNLFKGNNQGIAAKVEPYTYKTLEEVIDEDKDQLFVLLDGLEDPHNLGAILRSVDATGFDGVILPKNRSVSLSGTVAHVSTGAIEHVPVMQVNNLNTTIKTLQEKRVLDCRYRCAY